MQDQLMQDQLIQDQSAQENAPDGGGIIDEYGESADQMVDWLESLQQGGLAGLLGEPYVLLAIGLVLVYFLFRVLQFLRRRRKRLAPAKELHPRLQQYGGSVMQQLTPEARELASMIIATSSTDQLIGFQIVRQVEAVFVEGYPNAEQAVEALKAAAASRGGNAITNVHQQRGDRGRHAAGGDAVIVERLAGYRVMTQETIRDVDERSITKRDD